MRNEKLLAAIFCAAIAGMQAPAFAAGSHAGGHGVSDNIGQPGHAGDVDRTIHVEMGEMFFLPGDLKVEQGETIRFVVTNKGELVHEFNIATEEMHMAHNSEMMMMFENGTLEADRINHAAMSESDMAHDDANSLLLEPGQTAEMIWKFDGDALIELSCNIPGHREAGMMNAIEIMDALHMTGDS